MSNHPSLHVSTVRIALANIRCATTPDESVALAQAAIEQASVEKAAIVGFPECYVPGYRAPGRAVPPPDAAFLERAWSAIAESAAAAKVAVVLGTERLVDGASEVHKMVLARFMREEGRDFWSWSAGNRI